MRIWFILVSLLISSFLEAKPKISIITSVYNGDQFIKEFLEDITQQTIFDQCELIIINAHSPGNESPIIQEYVKRYSNIVYILLDHDPGLYAVWNIGIKLSQGIYITNANIDDRLSYNCYEVHAACLDACHEVDCVYSDKYITYQPHETFNKHTGVKWIPSPQVSRETMNQCWPCSNPMWRRSLHDRYGFFNEEYQCSGDWELWLRALEKGACFKKIAGYYLLYYLNPIGLSTGGRSALKMKEDNQIIERYGYLWGAATYRTYYSMARMLDMMHKDDATLWPYALNYYLKAYTSKPGRAEPLIRIAQYYVSKGEPALAYLFAHQAANIPYPTSDKELLEKELYDYVLDDILGQTAWYVQEYDDGEQALRRVIAAYPEIPHLQKNLEFYVQRKRQCY